MGCEVKAVGVSFKWTLLDLAVEKWAQQFHMPTPYQAT